MKMMKKTMVRAGSLALLTLCASCDRSGKVTREPAARLTREAQNVIDNLMALQRATPRRYVVSWTHPWPEYGSACSKRDASGKWVPKALDEIRLDGYVHGRTGKDPILYFTDFYCGLGTWLGQDEYARNLANMEGFIKKAYDNWRSVPAIRILCTGRTCRSSPKARTTATVIRARAIHRSTVTSSARFSKERARGAAKGGRTRRTRAICRRSRTRGRGTTGIWTASANS